MNRNKKGFTLMEVMVVVLIIAILAALSIPNVIGYARDARNDRAKATLYTIAQGYKNFRNEFPWATISTLGPLQNITLNGNDCGGVGGSLATLTGSNPVVSYQDLIKCSYLDNINYGGLRYNFYLGNGGNACNACMSGIPATQIANMVQPILAGMIGNDGGGYNGNYCALIDANNTLYETPVAED